MTDHVRLPDGARFTCQSCGRCCRGWSVPVDQATVDRLRAHNWGADPFEALSGGVEPYRIRLVNDRCFFLDPDDRCRIHREISYDAKPTVCKAFPLSVLEVEGTAYARLSFWCPTVAANTGKPLEQQLRWVKDTSRHGGQRTTPLTIDGGAELTARDFNVVHQALRRFVSDGSMPLADRLAAAAALVRRLATEAGSGRRADIDRTVATAEGEGLLALAREGRQGGHASGGRRAVSLFMAQDIQPGPLTLVRRFASLLLFNAGLGRLRSRAVSARASLGEIRRVAFPGTGSGDVLLARYFTSKLDGRRYVAGDATLVTGVNLLLAAYGLIHVLARMKAAAAGRALCGDDDVMEGVRAADLLVVEHTALFEGKVNQSLIKAALDNPALCADLLEWLEPGTTAGTTTA